MRLLYCTTVVVCGIIINVRGITLKDMIKQGDKTMKVITVATYTEAYRLANELSNEHAVLIADHIYESDKKFNGIIIKVEQ